jgi:UDP-2,3-diacylglucosamine pyrophosphatase LpxH
MEKAKEFLSHRSDYRYTVMGHTHNPMQVPIRITSKGLEQVYLNTGTWRARHIKGLSGGFVTLKNLTYTIIYSKEESKDQEFETWTGSLKELA